MTTAQQNLMNSLNQKQPVAGSSAQLAQQPSNQLSSQLQNYNNYVTQATKNIAPAAPVPTNPATTKTVGTPTNNTTNVVSNNNGNLPSQPDYQSQVDAAYAPVLAAYDQEGQYLDNSWLPTRLSGIQTDLNNQLGTLGNNVNDSKTGVNEQMNQLQSQYQQNQDQQVRTFNGLQQQAMGKYGGGSSLGQAMSDIQGQQYLRDQGQGQVAYTNAHQQLADKLVSLDKYELTTKQQLQSTATQQIAAANDNYLQLKAQVMNNKALAETDRGKQLIQLTSNWHQQLMNIQASLTQDAQRFDEQKQLMAMQIAGQYQQLQGTINTPVAYNPPTNQYAIPNSTNNTNQYTNFLPFLNNTPNNQQQVDAYGNLIDPLAK